MSDKYLCIQCVKADKVCISTDEYVELTINSTPNAKIQELIDSYYDQIDINDGDPRMNCIIANICKSIEELIEGE